MFLVKEANGVVDVDERNDDWKLGLTDKQVKQWNTQVDAYRRQVSWMVIDALNSGLDDLFSKN